MCIFHPKNLLGADSTHDIPTLSFGLPEVELGNLIVRNIPAFYKIIAVSIPLLSIGNLDLVELTVDLEALVMRVIQLVPKYLLALSD